MFRSVSSGGFPAKTYVLYVRELNSIAVKRFLLADEIVDGWTMVKQFKDKYLHEEIMHFLVPSFWNIASIVFKFMAWNTKINQIKYGN